MFPFIDECIRIVRLFARGVNLNFKSSGKKSARGAFRGGYGVYFGVMCGCRAVCYGFGRGVTATDVMTGSACDDRTGVRPGQKKGVDDGA